MAPADNVVVWYVIRGVQYFADDATSLGSTRNLQVSSGTARTPVGHGSELVHGRCLADDLVDTRHDLDVSGIGIIFCLWNSSFDTKRMRRRGRTALDGGLERSLQCHSQRRNSDSSHGARHVI